MDHSLNSSAPNLQCEEIQQKPLENIVDKELQDAVGKDFRVLPLYEKKVYEIGCIRLYSMHNNERLASRWQSRVSSLGVVVPQKTVKQFPDISDYHFHNYRNQFIPSQSLKNYPPPRLRLTPGPGVDERGQKPIPADMMLRKSVGVELKKASVNKERNFNAKQAMLR